MVYNGFEDDPGGMFELIDAMEASGYRLAVADSDYRKTKHRRALEMRAEKMPVTLIEAIIKGDPEVSDKLLARDCAEVEYNADRERVMARKANVKNINDQMNRESHL